MGMIILSEEDKTPATIQEIVYRLKIKDVMTVDVVTTGEDTSLKEIQKIMRERGITGVPIVDKAGMLKGMITIGDLIEAMEDRHINEKAGSCMRRDIVVLEEEMPLSFAINYFNKYSYHRFPVLNKDSHLVGIITGRDILVVLLRELNKEVQELEKKVNIESEKKPGQERNEFVVQQFDFENAGKASFAIKKALQAKGIPAGTIRRVAVAAYELEINIAIHSHGGKILFTLDEGSVTIVAKDNGPGIEDVERALGEGFSTANDWIRSLGFGAGMGLPNTKRVSDEFKISSNLGEGTVVISTVYLEKYGA